MEVLEVLGALTRVEAGLSSGVAAHEAWARLGRWSARNVGVRVRELYNLLRELSTASSFDLLHTLPGGLLLAEAVPEVWVRLEDETRITALDSV